MIIEGLNFDHFKKQVFQISKERSFDVNYCGEFQQTKND
jgi:hypothetical protein